MRISLIVLTAIFVICQGREILIVNVFHHNPGACPDLITQQHFDEEKHSGKWYTLSEYNVEIIRGKGRCSETEYSIDPYTGQTNFHTELINLQFKKWTTINGTTERMDPTKDDGKFVATITTEYYKKLNLASWVLGTDYSSYSVIYTCDKFRGNYHYYSIWLLSRKRNLDAAESEQFYKKTGAVLMANNIDPSIFETHDQTNCNPTIAP